MEIPKSPSEKPGFLSLPNENVTILN